MEVLTAISIIALVFLGVHVLLAFFKEAFIFAKEVIKELKG